MKDKIKAAYQQVFEVWGDAVNAGAPFDLIEPLSKAVNALRDAALIAAQPGLRQVHCVTQQGIIHMANQRDGSPRCGIELTIHDALEVSIRVPTCQTCQEIIINEKAKV